MATTSITPDMEANVTGVERADEQRFQHARDCEGNHDSEPPDPTSCALPLLESLLTNRHLARSLAATIGRQIGVFRG